MAIKTSLKQDLEDISSLLEEAKSMVQIGQYHNHIVNLQGLVYEHNKVETHSCKVFKTYQWNKQSTYHNFFRVKGFSCFYADWTDFRVLL